MREAPTRPSLGGASDPTPDEGPRPAAMGALAGTPAADPVYAAVVLAAEPPLPATAGGHANASNASTAAPSWAAALSAGTLPLPVAVAVRDEATAAPREVTGF